MRSTRSRLGVWVFAPCLASLTLSGCLSHPNGPARLQEVAHELNLNSRFGRMELAVEQVSPKGREVFLKHRAAWGGAIRVADFEFVGLSFKGEADADVTVRIAWYQPNEQELRSTTVRQRWHDFKGSWQLTDEQRLDGDLGLLGERVVREAPEAPHHTQFPTIRIGSTER